MREVYSSIAEIEAKYPDEWVLLAEPKVNRKTLEVFGGHVIAHAASWADFDELLGTAKFVGDAAIHYTGRSPVDSDVVFMLPDFGIEELGSRAMSEPYSTLAEIEAKYPAEWVLIDRPRLTKYQELRGGYVVCHDRNRDVVDGVLALRPELTSVAVQYNGPAVEGEDGVLL